MSMSRYFKALCWFIAGSKSQRRRVRLECARIAASLFGDFPIGEDHKLWLKDKTFRKKFAELSPLSPYSEERKWTLREFASFVQNVPGSMAECGCFEGGSAYFLAQANPQVKLHLFDSFEGLSTPTEMDNPKDETIPKWEQGDLSASESKTRRVLSQFKNVVYHKGWIPDKFHEVIDEQFRLLHIDVDLYQPTFDSLEFFYPKVSKGGVIILDDYGFSTCPGAFQATMDYIEENEIPEHIITLTTGQGIIIKK